jgi:two-component system, NarL family, sensor histidine kinase BarA
VTSVRPPRSLDELTLDGRFNIQELVSRELLGELLRNLLELFGVPLRVFATDGTLVAEAGSPSPLQAYLGLLPGGRRLVRETVEAVKGAYPEAEGDLRLVCSTGERYAVLALSYDGRSLGRAVIGPYLRAMNESLPRVLTECDPVVAKERLEQHWQELARCDEVGMVRLLTHLRSMLGLVLFSGHRALLASNMHLASVQESFRELTEKSATLQTAYERLKELDRLKSNFLATVSHELRTPLTSIIGYSEMLVAGIAGDINDEQRDFISTIHDKGEQLLELIKGLLDLTKLESGTLNLHKLDIPILPILKDIVHTLTPTARTKGVILSATGDAGIPSLWGDAARLRQVFLNLTENAIKFTPSGGHVTLSAQITHVELPVDEEGPAIVLRGVKRPMVEVRVADTGIGIPETERPRVFDAFYQVDSSSTREQGGTGLGLSIVKRLVDAHDGTVEIEGNEPCGTVFVVRIPCKRLSFVG